MGISLYQISWTEFSKKDYQNLDGSQKLLIDKSLNRIRQKGMLAGQPLQGNLKACNKLKHRKAGLRIIFTEEAGKIQIIQIVAIGKRSDHAVYKIATDRLNDEV